ncbi:hypothetical protein Xekj_00641 [Xenorhabdus sp. KJ12.1]|nr:hypothetical protein Xekj_00641 [Xenorhabdus sp. KJ12.1]
MSYLNRAYGSYKRELQRIFLTYRKDSGQDEYYTALYYNAMPADLIRWQDKHSQNIRAILSDEKSEEIIFHIEELLDLRKEIAAAPVIKPMKETEGKKKQITAIKEHIFAKIARLNKVYERAISLLEIFGGLNVHCNAHLVTNSYGTKFIRVFYYLDGKLTPLDTILAAYGEHKRRKSLN